MVRIIIFGLVGYLLYKFIVKFVIPLAKVVSHTNQSINELKKKAQQQESEKNRQNNQKPPTREVDGEYIDYEEVK